jgi:recombination protein RecR
MSFGPVIDELIEAFRILPGVGQKTAQRMALGILERQRAGGQRLSAALANAVEKVGRCEDCQNFCEADLCAICSDPRRDDSIVCVVESASDLLAVEQAHHFRGRYFVLSGSLSPLDGRGPNEIGIPKLLALIAKHPVEELILATNPTVEGEATAHYISDLVKRDGILLTRLAHGIPLGGELGFVDGGTLGHAFSGRKPIL